MSPAGAADVRVQSRIVYETADGFYINAGSASGVAPGDSGTVQRDAAEIARVEVVEVAKSTSLVRVLPGSGRIPPRPGDTVVLLVHPKDDGEKEEREPSPTLKGPDDDDFVPLLVSPDQRSVETSEASDILHGQVWVKQLIQFEDESLSDFSITRFGSSGTYERIGGTPWALEWSGDVSYTDGDALSDTDDFREIVPRVFRLNLFRKFDDTSFVRIGRLLPRELPGVGYLDGFQGEKALNDSLRLGVSAGLKPTRARLDVSIDEPTVVPYVTLEAGEVRGVYYSGTAGVLASMYEGDADRLAFLLDQRVTLFSRMSVYWSSEVDFDIGGAEFRSGTNVTRLDALVTYDVVPLLGLRGGVDHFQREDTRAVRDQLELTDPDLFDRGYWRYFAGASHVLPWRLRLTEELGVTDSPTEDYEPYWSVSLSRTGLPFLPAAHLSVTAYSLNGGGLEGYGGRVSAYLPFLDGRLSISPSLGVRILDADFDPDAFEFGDVSVRVNWAATEYLELQGGISHVFGSDVSAYLVEVGLVFRF